MIPQYYNDCDPFCAQWIRNLIAGGLVPEGVVDPRDVRDVRYEDVIGHDRCHFFAGILGWELALQWAGWPEDLPVWSASLPCQPFSVAGRGLGEDDERHLWPHFRKLIEECRPQTIFGEQVASAKVIGYQREGSRVPAKISQAEPPCRGENVGTGPFDPKEAARRLQLSLREARAELDAAVGWTWCARVFADLESLGYAIWACVLPAASVGAPHIRQRLFWVADAGGERRQQECRSSLGDEAANGGAGRYGGAAEGDHFAVGYGEGGGLADAARGGRDAGIGHRAEAGHELDAKGSREDGGPWSNAVWIPCADGKSRRIESGLEPLAHGVPSRVGRLRAYGNAIVPQVAAEFIRSYLDLLDV